MKEVKVNDFYQKDYVYQLSEPVGRNFMPDFNPDLSPQQMLELGVFGGKYMSDKPKEFPATWFGRAKLSHYKDPQLNYFGVDASLPSEEWMLKGWIKDDDPRGWFQWYCRYYLGRRIAGYDQWQIKRWKAMSRHIGQIKKHCTKGDQLCRRKQRQALLHWAYDSRKL